MAFAFQVIMALAMIVAGVLHFVIPETYVRMVPKSLPAPLVLVNISGIAEVLGGVGLMVPLVQRAAAWGLIALFVAVFPANVNMAVNRIGFSEKGTPVWILWARLPLQAAFIAWAYAYT